MPFNLAEAAGYGKIMSNLDTQEIIQIPCNLIDTNEKNFFAVDDVQDLMDSIAINGVLQPLLLVHADDRYRIIAGHRRFKAAGELGIKSVPAVVLPEMSESMEWFVLMQTNTTSRQLTYAEKQEAAIRLKKHLMQLKAEGVKIPGRLRDIVAEQLEISKTEVARMEVIEKNLIPEGKELMKAGRMSPSAAYAMAKTSPECQKEIIDSQPGAFVPAAIEQHATKRTLDYINPDCQHPIGWWQHNEKEQGRKLSCPAWASIKRHKDKGHPEKCPGCCANCESYKHGYRCPDACGNFRKALDAANAKKASDAEAKKKLDAHAAAKEHFKNTPFVHIGEAVRPLVDRGGISLEDIAGWWSDNMYELLPDDEFDDFDESHVASMIHAETVDDVNWPLAAFVAFCEAVDLTPNDLLGYPAAQTGSGWHKYPDSCPDEGQRVVVYRKTQGGLPAHDEYIYKRGAWYFPDFDDPELDDPAVVPDITAWIDLP